MDKKLERQGVSLAYSDSGGGGKTLLLMHGWGCTRQTLKSIEDLAIAKGWRVLNVDFPGFGDSSEPPEVWGVEQYTDLIQHLLEVEKISKTAILGHSFGGRVAIMLAARRPDEIEKVILVDAAGVKPRRTLRQKARSRLYKIAMWFRRHTMSAEDFAPFREAQIQKRGSADYKAASPRMRGILSKVVNQDLTNLMPSISAPTLLIWGENDTATPLRDAKIMEKLIPDAGLVVFPRCGHYSFLDNPAQFRAVLSSFLDS